MNRILMDLPGASESQKLKVHRSVVGYFLERFDSVI